MNIKDIFLKVKKFICKFFDKNLFNINWTCSICGEDVFDKGYFCEDCKKLLPKIGDNFCNHCGRPTKTKEVYCLTCKGILSSIDKGRSSFVYKSPISNLIKKLKYENARYLAEVFAYYLSETYKISNFDADLITFVPMTAKSKRQRGYNQSELLARFTSKLLQIPVKNLVRKKKETIRQAKLDRSQRLKNLLGVYGVINKKSVCGKKIVIIDDVTTTGSTAEAIAKVLKKAGATKVYLLTVATVSIID